MPMMKRPEQSGLITLKDGLYILGSITLRIFKPRRFIIEKMVWTLF